MRRKINPKHPGLFGTTPAAACSEPPVIESPEIGSLTHVKVTGLADSPIGEYRPIEPNEAVGGEVTITTVGELPDLVPAPKGDWLSNELRDELAKSPAKFAELFDVHELGPPRGTRKFDTFTLAGMGYVGVYTVRRRATDARDAEPQPPTD